MKKYLFILSVVLVAQYISAQALTKNGSVVSDATVSSLKVGTVTYPNIHNATAGQVLITNASGVASWITPTAGGASGRMVLNTVTIEYF
jgi:5,10-methylene-tetrahydrofolate dehydrogenase/methenyl tetrahydrofolate cyclohydrolase